MYDQYAEFITLVHAPIDQVFDWLDDQMRLSQHMAKRSWQMGWGRMEILLDDRRGRAVGSRMELRGRVLGIPLHLEEVVVEHQRPFRKQWETVGRPRLLVIGAYQMGFDLETAGASSRLRVRISYGLPTGAAWLAGKLLGRWYANWCVRKMAQDARDSFAPPHRTPGVET